MRKGIPEVSIRIDAHWLLKVVQREEADDKTLIQVATSSTELLEHWHKARGQGNTDA
jgi:hypothetical protein